ncbi:MAG: hypothetical protein ACXWPM_10080 [Bdellovibrionota bacterium]
MGTTYQQSENEFVQGARWDWGQILLGAAIAWVVASAFEDWRTKRRTPELIGGRVLKPRDRRSDRPFEDLRQKEILEQEAAMESEGGAIHTLSTPDIKVPEPKSTVGWSADRPMGFDDKCLDPLTAARMTDHNVRGGHSEGMGFRGERGSKPKK